MGTHAASLCASHFGSCEGIRELARIGANINQLARWANTYKSHTEAIQILTALASLERSLNDFRDETCI